MMTIYKEEYGAGYYYLDRFSYWSYVNDHIEFLKICMAEYKNKANEAHTIKERLYWMKEITKLISWGFEPKF